MSSHRASFAAHSSLQTISRQILPANQQVFLHQGTFESSKRTPRSTSASIRQNFWNRLKSSLSWQTCWCVISQLLWMETSFQPYCVSPQQIYASLATITMLHHVSSPVSQISCLRYAESLEREIWHWKTKQRDRWVRRQEQQERTDDGVFVRDWRREHCHVCTQGEPHVPLQCPTYVLFALESEWVCHRKSAGLPVEEYMTTTYAVSRPSDHQAVAQQDGSSHCRCTSRHFLCIQALHYPALRYTGLKLTDLY